MGANNNLCRLGNGGGFRHNLHGVLQVQEQKQSRNGRHGEGTERGVQQLHLLERQHDGICVRRGTRKAPGPPQDADKRSHATNNRSEIEQTEPSKQIEQSEEF